MYHRVLARVASDHVYGGQLLLPERIRSCPPGQVPPAGATYGEKSSASEMTAIALPLLEVDYHSVLAHSVPSPPGAGPEGECFTSLSKNLSGCNYAGIPRRVLESGTPNVLVPGCPAATFMAMASLRAGSSANHLGVAAGALAYAARTLNTSTLAVDAISVQAVMVSRLRTAVVFFPSSMAGGQTFAAEQLAGVIGIPAQNINDAWADAVVSAADMRAYLQQVSTWLALDDRGCNTSSARSVPLEPPSSSAFVSALVALCPQRLQAPALVVVDTLSSSPLLLADVVALVARALNAFVPPVLKVASLLPPYALLKAGLYDSFHRGQLGLQPEWSTDGRARYVVARGASVVQGNLALSGPNVLLVANMSTAHMALGFNLTVEVLPVLDGPDAVQPESFGLAWHNNSASFGVAAMPTSRDPGTITFYLRDSTSR